MKRLLLIVLIALAGIGVGCMRLSLKQKAVAGLQGSESALEASHDAERTLCSPTANPALPITHCDGTLAAMFGLTDARHQQLAGLYVRAFDVQQLAAVALRTWRAGDPAPTSLGEYQRVVTEILGLIVQVLPRTQPAASYAQIAVNKATTSAVAAGGQ